RCHFAIPLLNRAAQAFSEAKSLSTRHGARIERLAIPSGKPMQRQKAVTTQQLDSHRRKKAGIFPAAA
ncbi:MAG: hypothetical protein KJ884_00150, partial [Gammaproteobacteria bacterium]|nr:hypothetical protein [Gammaproteobacteria bacterium]